MVWSVTSEMKTQAFVLSMALLVLLTAVMWSNRNLPLSGENPLGSIKLHSLFISLLRDSMKEIYWKVRWCRRLIFLFLQEICFIPNNYFLPKKSSVLWLGSSVLERGHLKLPCTAPLCGLARAAWLRKTFRFITIPWHPPVSSNPQTTDSPKFSFCHNIHNAC